MLRRAFLKGLGFGFMALIIPRRAFLMATLTVAPNPASPSTLCSVAGSGFQNAKTRLLLDGVGATTNIFRPRKDGTFNVGITVSSTAKTQMLVAQQLGSTWTDKASVSVVVQAVVVTPPPPPPPPLTGWREIFRENFDKPAVEGAFLATYPNMYAYPLGWKDTSKNGSYDPGIISVHDGTADVSIRTSGGLHRVAAFGPVLGPGTDPYFGPVNIYQQYGRYEVRAKVDSMHGYKGAWLLWPKSETWPRDGEIDFPEADFDASIYAFMHYQGGTSGADQAAFPSTYIWQDWHTYVTEWTPTRCEFFVDGVSIGKAVTRIPNTPMRWVIQNETTLGGFVPADAVVGHVLVDWVAVWAYAP